MKSSTINIKDPLFQLDGTPPIKDIIPLGLQHVVAAIVGVITPALLISGTCNLSVSDQTLLIQMSLIITGLSTLLQLFPIGRIGAGLPLIMGVSFAYIPTLLAIGGEFDLATIFGAQIVGGSMAIIFGIFLKRLRVFFPPLITGTVIFTIGLSLYPTAIKYMAGGVGTPEFGSPKNWLVAIITLVSVIFFGNFTKGVFKLASILCGMIVGYVVALCLGMVSFDVVAAASWSQMPKPMHFGITFNVSACITLGIVYIVNAVQTIGDISSTTMGGLDREPTDKELSGGIISQGVSSIFGAFWGGLPTATFSQNVGIVTLNRVVNKKVFLLTAIIMLVAGFVPKFASILTTIPQSVIGGATISVFATITMTGMRMIASAGLTPRNTSIVGLSVALGSGVISVSGALAGFPDWVTTVFGSSSVVIATIVAITLNLILPKDKTPVD